MKHYVSHYHFDQWLLLQNPNKTKPASCTLTHTADPSISSLQTSIKFSVICRVSFVYSPSPIFVCLPHSHTLRVFLNVLWWSFTGLMRSLSMAAWNLANILSNWTTKHAMKALVFLHVHFNSTVSCILYNMNTSVLEMFGFDLSFFCFFSPTCPLPLHLIGIDPWVLLPARDVCEQ